MAKGFRAHSLSSKRRSSRDGHGQSPAGVSRRDSKVVKRSSPHLQSRRVYFTSPQSNQHCALSVTGKVPREKKGSNTKPSFVKSSLCSCNNENKSPPRGGKSSSNKGRASQHWKHLLFRRLKAKDNKILRFLQTRPPPPTVGLSCLVDASGDNIGEATIPEPYTHLFDQFESKDSNFPEDASVEMDADEEMQPGEKVSPPHITSPYVSMPLTRATSIDLFGSYWQDYQQSDYINNNLFDENMLIC